MERESSEIQAKEKLETQKRFSHSGRINPSTRIIVEQAIGCGGLSALSPNQRIVVERLYLNPQGRPTQQKFASEFGATRTTVRKIEKKAVRALNAFLIANPNPTRVENKKKPYPSVKGRTMRRMSVMEEHQITLLGNNPKEKLRELLRFSSIEQIAEEFVLKRATLYAWLRKFELIKQIAVKEKHQKKLLGDNPAAELKGLSGKFSPEEIAGRLKVSTATVYNWLNGHNIKPLCKKYKK